MPSRRLLLLLPALVLAACGGDDNGDDPAAGPFDVVTYNLGLARGYVPYTDERAPEAVASLAAVDADLACVQEVWFQEHVDALKAATADKWPETIFLEPDPGEAGGEPSCTDTELDPLEACVDAACADVAPQDLAGCVLANCGTEFTSLQTTCQTCLTANIGADLEAIRLVCTSGGSGGYAYGGSFGIGLLTHRTIEAQDHLVLDSTYNRRAVIHARIDEPRLGGPVDVFCTHLTAIFSNVPYPGEGSWEAEQAAQIDTLLAWVDAQSEAGRPKIFLGDLNTGPAAGSAVAEYPDNFQKFLDAGFWDPYADANAECTFCPDNPLVDGGEPVLIDHVLLKDAPQDPGIAGVERRFTQPVTFEADGETVSVPPSDHYGLEATWLDQSTLGV